MSLLVLGWWEALEWGLLLVSHVCSILLSSIWVGSVCCCKNFICTVLCYCIVMKTFKSLKLLHYIHHNTITQYNNAIQYNNTMQYHALLLLLFLRGCTNNNRNRNRKLVSLFFIFSVLYSNYRQHMLDIHADITGLLG